MFFSRKTPTTTSKNEESNKPDDGPKKKKGNSADRQSHQNFSSSSVRQSHQNFSSSSVRQSHQNFSSSSVNTYTDRSNSRSLHADIWSSGIPGIGGSSNPVGLPSQERFPPQNDYRYPPPVPLMSQNINPEPNWNVLTPPPVSHPPSNIGLSHQTGNFGNAPSSQIQYNPSQNRGPSVGGHTTSNMRPSEYSTPNVTGTLNSVINTLPADNLYSRPPPPIPTNNEQGRNIQQAHDYQQGRNNQQAYDYQHGRNNQQRYNDINDDYKREKERNPDRSNNWGSLPADKWNPVIGGPTNQVGLPSQDANSLSLSQAFNREFDNWGVRRPSVLPPTSNIDPSLLARNVMNAPPVSLTQYNPPQNMMPSGSGNNVLTNISNMGPSKNILDDLVGTLDSVLKNLPGEIPYAVQPPSLNREPPLALASNQVKPGILQRLGGYKRDDEQRSETRYNDKSGNNKRGEERSRTRWDANKREEERSRGRRDVNRREEPKSRRERSRERRERSRERRDVNRREEPKSQQKRNNQKWENKKKWDVKVREDQIKKNQNKTKEKPAADIYPQGKVKRNWAEKGGKNSRSLPYKFERVTPFQYYSKYFVEVNAVAKKDWGDEAVKEHIPEEFPMSCVFCKKDFDSVKLFKKHRLSDDHTKMARHHCNKINATLNYLHLDVKFATEKALAHLEWAHKENPTEETKKMLEDSQLGNACHYCHVKSNDWHKSLREVKVFHKYMRPYCFDCKAMEDSYKWKYNSRHSYEQHLTTINHLYAVYIRSQSIKEKKELKEAHWAEVSAGLTKEFKDYRQKVKQEELFKNSQGLPYCPFTENMMEIIKSRVECEDYSLEDISSKPCDFSEPLGQQFVINHTSIMCHLCKRELPEDPAAIIEHCKSPVHCTMAERVYKIVPKTEDTSEKIIEVKEELPVLEDSHEENEKIKEEIISDADDDDDKECTTQNTEEEMEETSDVQDDDNEENVLDDENKDLTRGAKHKTQNEEPFSGMEDEASEEKVCNERPKRKKISHLQDDDEEDTVSPKKSRGRKSVVNKVNDAEDASVSPVKGKGRPKRSTVKGKEKTNDVQDETEEEEEISADDNEDVLEISDDNENVSEISDDETKTGEGEKTDDAEQDDEKEDLVKQGKRGAKRKIEKEDKMLSNMQDEEKEEFNSKRAKRETKGRRSESSITENEDLDTNIKDDIDSENSDDDNVSPKRGRGRSTRKTPVVEAGKGTRGRGRKSILKDEVLEVETVKSEDEDEDTKEEDEPEDSESTEENTVSPKRGKGRGRGRGRGRRGRKGH